MLPYNDLNIPLAPALVGWDTVGIDPAQPEARAAPKAAPAHLHLG